MKMRHSVKWMLIGVLAMPGLTACSFGGGDEETEEVEASEDGNAANAAEAEGEEGNETAAVEGAEGADANANGTDGNVAFDENGGNAAAAEGGVASNDIPPELLNAENPTANLGAEGSGTGDTAAMGAEGTLPTDAAAPEATPVADPAASAPTDAVAAAPAPVEVASGDARVYYVSAETAALFSAPSATGASVGNLKKGDPVLVKIEGAWANVLNRGYVEVSSLSQAPVGRSSSGPKSWQ